MKFSTPKDALDYVLNQEKEYAFLSSIALLKQNFSIGEITDAIFKIKEDRCKLLAKSFHLNIDINDDEIYTAVRNGLYVSAFIARHDENYQVHFLVHPYPKEMKSRFEEEITKSVIQYMIMKTIMTLRLDTSEKIDSYMGESA